MKHDLRFELKLNILTNRFLKIPIAIVFFVLLFPSAIWSQTEKPVNDLMDEWHRAEKSGFPEFSVTVSDKATPGYFIFAISPYLAILDHWGKPMFYMEIPGGVENFSPQVNGLFSYYRSTTHGFHVMNDHFQVVDTFYMKNGYNADYHEFLILEDGSSILMGGDPQLVDMSALYPGGFPAATVIGAVFQELNPSRQVVFQWLGWDHFDILDCDTNLVNLTASSIDYVHLNAILPDTDGNYLLSSRHLNEITKINSTSGDIIWRLGGVNNEFQFINDPFGLSGQHSPVRLADGNLLLFDNGNNHQPQYSRGVIYQIDEQDKTATLIREFRESPNVFAFAMGNSQSMNNNHVLISWGKNYSQAFLTEFDEYGNICSSIKYKNPGSFCSYNVSFVSEIPILFSTDRDSIHFETVTIGDSLIQTVLLENKSGLTATLTGCAQEDGPFFLDNTLPLEITDEDTVRLRIYFRPQEVGDYQSNMYLQFSLDSLTSEDHLFATRIFLSGNSILANSTPDDPVSSKITVYPNPCTDVLFLDNSSDVKEISLISPLGVTMIQMDLHNQSRVHLNTARLTPGIYILEIRFHDGHLEKRVIIRAD